MGFWDKIFGSSKKAAAPKVIDGAVQECPRLKKKAELVVLVRHAITKDPIGNVSVAVTRGPTPSGGPTGAQSGVATFTPMEPGDYQVDAALPGDLAAKFEEVPSGNVTLPQGSIVQKVIEVMPLSKLRVKVVWRKPNETLMGVVVHVA